MHVWYRNLFRTAALIRRQTMQKVEETNRMHKTTWCCVVIVRGKTKRFFLTPTCACFPNINQSVNQVELFPCFFLLFYLHHSYRQWYQSKDFSKIYRMICSNLMYGTENRHFPYRENSTCLSESWPPLVLYTFWFSVVLGEVLFIIYKVTFSHHNFFLFRVFCDYRWSFSFNFENVVFIIFFGGNWAITLLNSFWDIKGRLL